MASLTVYCGPMFAGKTSALIAAYESAPANSRIALKPKMDDRFGSGAISTHGGKSIPAIELNNMQRVLQRIGPSVRFVFIDEGQFFMDLADGCSVLLSAGKTVYVSGLNATAHRRPWPSMSDVMAMADSIVYLSLDRCHCCGIRPGCHTVYRYAEESVVSSTIRIGGGDVYRTVCRECLQTGRWAVTEQ